MAMKRCPDCGEKYSDTYKCSCSRIIESSSQKITRIIVPLHFI